MAFAETQKLVVELDLKGNLTQKLGQTARALQGFDRATSNTQRSLSKFGRNIEKGVAVGAAAVAGGVGLVVRAAADYESAFAGVRKTVSATDAQLNELSAQFRQLSKEIPISASDLARLGEAGGALGVPTAQLKEFVRVTALLGVTTNLSADQAADSLGVLSNVLHLTGDDYSRFASSLVALGNAGASTESQIVEIAQRAGAAGKLIGVSTQQVLGFSSAVASLGIESEAGGTAIQKFFIDMAKFSAAGGKDLKEIAKVAGTTGKAFQKAFKDDAGAALQEFLKGLGKLPQAKQLAVLEDLGFNDARITRTLLGLANNTSLVADQMGIANQAFKDNTALTKEANQRFNTFDSQLQITKNTLTDMAITIGGKLLPKITPLLKELNQFVGAHQADIAKFGDQLADGFQKFASALKEVDWKPFVDGLKLSGDIAKTVISAFRSLPEDLQKLVIAGFALNKVTGGLGTSLVKDIGGSVLGNLARLGGSKLPGPLGSIAGSLGATPVFVTNWPLGGIPGGGKVIDKATDLLGDAAKGGGIVAAFKALATSAAGPLAALTAGVTASTLGIMGLGWLINATSTPEQQAATQANVLANERFKRSGGKIPYDNTHPLPVTVKNGQINGVISRSAIPDVNAQTGFVTKHLDTLAGKLKDDRDIVKANLRVIGNEFKNIANTLKNSNKPSEVKNAIAEAMKLIGSGRGNASATEKVLSGLKSALKNTHDPKLQASLRTAIGKVEKVLPGRQFAAKQLAKADKILHSNEASGRKINDLKAIEKALKDRGLPAAAKSITAKIDQAKREQTYASRATTQAIKDKDMSPRITIPITNRISVGDIVKTQTTFGKFGKYQQ